MVHTERGAQVVNPEVKLGIMVLANVRDKSVSEKLTNSSTRFAVAPCELRIEQQYLFFGLVVRT